jgi:hypothetical protein
MFAGAMIASSLAVSVGANAQTQARPLDPLTERMLTLCGGKRSCMHQQRLGVRRFLATLTGAKPPSRHAVQRCLKRATNKDRIADWGKAARCL